MKQLMFIENEKRGKKMLTSLNVIKSENVSEKSLKRVASVCCFVMTPKAI